jgi:hypothetical protein
MVCLLDKPKPYDLHKKQSCYPKGNVLTYVVQIPLVIDAPPNSLMDSTESPKVKTLEGERVRRAPWLATLLRQKGVLELQDGLGRVTSSSIIHTDLHKPNNKLVCA